MNIYLLKHKLIELFYRGFTSLEKSRLWRLEPSCLRTRGCFLTGFTLIETFVAITILMIAILGPLGLLAKAFSDANYVRNQIIATQLAQEGIELVVARRDRNLYFNLPAFQFGYYASSCGEETDGCMVDTYTDIDDDDNDPYIRACDGTCPSLKEKIGSSDDGFSSFDGYIFNYYDVSATNINSGFVRTIYLTPPVEGDPPAMKVKVKVSWRQKTGLGFIDKEVTETTYLYDNIY